MTATAKTAYTHLEFKQGVLTSANKKHREALCVTWGPHAKKRAIRILKERGF